MDLTASHLPHLNETNTNARSPLESRLSPFQASGRAHRRFPGMLRNRTVHLLWLCTGSRPRSSRGSSQGGLRKKSQAKDHQDDEEHRSKPPPSREDSLLTSPTLLKKRSTSLRPRYPVSQVEAPRALATGEPNASPSTHARGTTRTPAQTSIDVQGILRGAEVATCQIWLPWVLRLRHNF